MTSCYYDAKYDATVCGGYKGDLAMAVGVSDWSIVSCSDCLRAVEHHQPARKDTDLCGSGPSRSDLGAPSSALVDSGATEDTNDPQISDPVNSPGHYRWLPVEAIEITEHFNFCMGNALKYILRADHKGRPEEDIAKAVWYLQRELENRRRDAT